MTPARRRDRRQDAGSAMVELIAAVPLIAIGVIGGLQLAAVGLTDLLAARGAQAGARAIAAGQDPQLWVDRELGELFRPHLHDLTVREATSDGDGRVEVRLRVPVLLPWVEDDPWVLGRAVDVLRPPTSAAQDAAQDSTGREVPRG